MTTANTTMSLAELLARYNELSPTKRKAQFKNKNEALARIAALLPSDDPPVSTVLTPVVANTEYPDMPAALKRTKAELTHSEAVQGSALASGTDPTVEVTPPVEAPAKKKSAAKKSKKPDVVKFSQPKKDGGYIKTLTAENPKRPGTMAADHWDKMQGGISVEAYLAKFADKESRNTARRWLYNFSKIDGVVSIEPGAPLEA